MINIFCLQWLWNGTSHRYSVHYRLIMVPLCTVAELIYTVNPIFQKIDDKILIKRVMGIMAL